jgi:Peptidase S24-like
MRKQPETNRERAALNDRFKQVYRQLELRGSIVEYDRNASKSKFAKTIGLRSNQIDRCLTDAYYITFEAATLLCEIYGVNRKFMFDGGGTPFGGVPKNLTSDVREVNFMPHAQVTFAGLAAFAGDTIGEDAPEEREVYMLPGISGEMVAFNVSGNSMSPTLSMGDIIFCQEIQGPSDILDGEMYVVSFKGENAINVKRVERVFDKRGNWTHLRFISDNTDYDPFDVELSDIRAAYRVTRRLTAHMGR